MWATDQTACCIPYSLCKQHLIADLRHDAPNSDTPRLTLLRNGKEVPS
jgi:hypothetical protein